MERLIISVRIHAEDNYGKEGWDFLVECWSDEDIARMVRGCLNSSEAIASCRRSTKLMAERRAEVEAEIF